MAQDDVASFFAGRSVLITGATGFMGKVLVEKLVRECPGLDTVYALVRHKRGRTPADRINEYVTSQVSQEHTRNCE
ncbi:Fatty acyl-CoA reductase 1 [Frankliniella fusca]|uniref:Fatty acyl-CoA reductase n=1 Tax=Frankliniella fusca TaxID=407009 RepID=A0AAE1H282_9NEOP|nr:Fatty acyl-CoA reductase 1 [Frankliniella fusca]